jgi:hypothetical protein
LGGTEEEMNGRADGKKMKGEEVNKLRKVGKE